MLLPPVYVLLARHQKFLRGASGVGALVAILWGLVGEPLYRRAFPYAPIQVVEKSFISNAKIGGKLVYHAEGHRNRTGCPALIQAILTDSTGARIYLPPVQGGNEPVGPYSHSIPAKLPDGVAPGPVLLEMSFTFSHVQRASCNEILRQSGQFTVYPADHPGDPSRELNPLSVNEASVPY